MFSVVRGFTPVMLLDSVSDTFAPRGKADTNEEVSHLGTMKIGDELGDGKHKYSATGAAELIG
jgi:hypothetical protein